LNSGKLLLVKNNPPLAVAWLADPSITNRNQKRSHLTAYLSPDDGVTWSGGLIIDDRISVSYPDGVEAPDGRIFIIYDYNRITDKEILMACLPRRMSLRNGLWTRVPHFGCWSTRRMASRHNRRRIAPVLFGDSAGELARRVESTKSFWKEPRAWRR
jgi:hypothetical protein